VAHHENEPEAQDQGVEGAHLFNWSLYTYRIEGARSSVYLNGQSIATTSVRSRPGGPVMPNSHDQEVLDSARRAASALKGTTLLFRAPDLEAITKGLLGPVVMAYKS
jgi:hypothetical protein